MSQLAPAETLLKNQAVKVLSLEETAQARERWPDRAMDTRWARIWKPDETGQGTTLDGTREWRNCFLATARGLGFETSSLEPCVLVLRSPQQGYHDIIGVLSLRNVSLSDTGKWERENSAVEKPRKVDPCASGSQPTSRVWTLCLSGN